MALVDYFLKIDGIEGESQDAKHKNEIQLESYSFGATQSGSHAFGGGGGAGKVQLQDFHFVSNVNKASPKLFQACASGEHIKTALLTCRKAGKDQQEYLKIKLSDLLISSVQQSGSSNGSIIPQEQVTINFAKIQIEYHEQDAAGNLKGAMNGGWDVKTNKVA
jgi:type VI secretion system secreted protein Hcp